MFNSLKFKKIWVKPNSLQKSKLVVFLNKSLKLNNKKVGDQKIIIFFLEISRPNIKVKKIR